MKTRILICFFLFIGLVGTSQIDFEEGYFINENGQKITCQIKNRDWKNNPTEFEYRIYEYSESTTGRIKEVKEFGIGTNIKYVRSKVEIDRASDMVADLSNIRAAEFKEEILFLKTLVEGKAKLFEYEEGNLTRYFYSIDDSKVIQLVYKRYLFEGKKIRINDRYKQQLTMDLKCDKIKNIEKLTYEKKGLVRLFKDYNDCTKSSSIIYNKIKKGESFDLIVKPAIRLNSLNMGSDLSEREVDFEKGLGYSFGISSEFNLLFNKNKWSILVEPTFQMFNSERGPLTFIVGGTTSNTAKIKSLEIPVGIRHYFFLNHNSKIFVNGLFLTDVQLNTNVSGLKSKTPLLSLAFGGGYSIKSYSLEVRYYMRRNLLNDYRTVYSDYKGIAFLLGYRLF